MTVNYRFYESPSDLDLQYDFWNKMTKSLPYAWKPTLSPKLFEQQSEFNPKSRCFAFDGDQLVGYMSFSGKGEFVSLGYPWVLPEYEGKVQDELFEKVFQFAISEEYGGKLLAQRFRAQWENQINYFLSKGFAITSRSQIVGAHYPLLIKNIQSIPGFTFEIKDQFQFNVWKELKMKQQILTNEQIKMMNEYYSSIDFDYAVECKLENQPIAYFGITIRPDTGYSEILAVAYSDAAIPYFYDIMSIIHNENVNRKVQSVTITKSQIPKGILQEKLGFTPLTEDVMMHKR
ncbi:hypothetical protein [Gottfriedia luciferensis]|uniref:hypothetical protein n=1 Tax=Gottfriedia luciferensis TaxID=178774 RepID=UPI000B4331A1|nr:hypothetical protein [Gottfriedia luciferensis]